jgi:hypothetical protein
MSELLNFTEPNASFSPESINIKNIQIDTKRQKSKQRRVKKVAKIGKKPLFFSHYGNFSLISFGY